MIKKIKKLAWSSHKTIFFKRRLQRDRWKIQQNFSKQPNSVPASIRGCLFGLKPFCWSFYIKRKKIDLSKIVVFSNSDSSSVPLCARCSLPLAYFVWYNFYTRHWCIRCWCLKFTFSRHCFFFRFSNLYHVFAQGGYKNCSFAMYGTLFTWNCACSSQKLYNNFHFFATPSDVIVISFHYFSRVIITKRLIDSCRNQKEKQKTTAPAFMSTENVLARIWQSIRLTMVLVVSSCIPFASNFCFVRQH